jgi:SAM-dependent methyltransferase
MCVVVVNCGANSTDKLTEGSVMRAQSFDATAYKTGQGREWGRSATGWKHHWDIWEKGAQHINERLVELAHIQPGHQVVDIASGLGEPAFTAARQVGPTGQVIGTDIAPEMLAMAREQAHALGLHQVTFRAMDAEEPDLPRAAFNAILCRFGLMFLPNLTTALMRLRHLLVPGGRFAAAVWGTAEHVPFSLLNRITQQVRQLPPPPPGMPNAFCLGDEQVLRQHFRDAGFTEVHTERSLVTLAYTSLDEFVAERLATSASARSAIEGASEDERSAIWHAVTEALQSYIESDGMLRLRNAVICAVAW